MGSENGMGIKAVLCCSADQRDGDELVCCSQSSFHGSARAPLAPASSYSRLCFLPFSTENSDKSPNSKPTASGASHKDRWSCHNIGGKIHQEIIASYSNLDGIPFDFIKKHPEGGAIFLRRKTDDEIVNILAMPVLTNDDLEESLQFVYNDSFIYDDFDIDDGGDDGDEMINEEDVESIEEEVDGEDSELSAEEVGVYSHSEFSEVEVDNSESIVEEVNREYSEEDVDRVTGLSLLVKIQYGNNLDRCLEFVGHYIFINGISF